VVGIFKTKESMKRAYERIRRPGENIKTESQAFSTPERAVGAIQVRHPDFVRGRMNDFKMATIKGNRRNGTFGMVP
jgi:hypothetical protein